MRAYPIAFMVLVFAVASSSRAQELSWIAAPSFEEMKAAFPQRARDERVAGEVVLVCHADPSGQLSECRTEMEMPTNYGFGQAALSLAPKYRFAIDRMRKVPATVALPMFFSRPGPTPPSRDPKFTSVKRGFEWLGPVGPYWPMRALTANRGGRAKIDCRVVESDRLSDCRMAFEDPVGSDFASAMLRMAKAGWMIAGPKPQGAPDPEDGYWRFEVVYPPRSLCEDPRFPGDRLGCRRAVGKRANSPGSSS